MKKNRSTLYERSRWLNGMPQWHASIFSTHETESNYQLLVEVFGENWIAGHLNNKFNSHPLISQWRSNGPSAFIYLNTLADDIRLVKEKPYFQEVIKEYKKKEGAGPARQVIHTAAMFERASPGRLKQFFRASDQSVPDFLLYYDGMNIPVEAKLLTSSKVEEDFNSVAEKIEEKIKNSLKIDNFHFEIQIVIKDFTKSTDVADICDRVMEGVYLRSDYMIQARLDDFNIFITPLFEEKSRFFNYIRILIYTPKSDKEDIRVLERGKNASKQLNCFHQNKSPGLCCIGIGEKQNVPYIFEMFKRRFECGQLSGISALMLQSGGTYSIKDEHSYIDLLAFLKNPNASYPIPRNLTFKTISNSLNIITDLPVDEDIPCYTFKTCKGKIKAGCNASLFIPSISKLHPSMLE